MTEPNPAADRAPEPGDLDGPVRRLESELRRLRPVAVAFSGGVDSTLLYAEARRCLGEEAVGVIGVSPSLARVELEEAREIARFLEAPLWEIPTAELSIPGYRANAGDRCFYCKRELYGRLRHDPRLRGWTLCDGTHAEDDSGDRPGMRAARECDVASPLRSCGFGKTEIRALARRRGLPNWEKPARPCLSSRILTGTPVTPDLLARVEALEAVLHRFAFRVFRVRTDGEEIFVELGREEIGRIGERGWREAFREEAGRQGYGRASIRSVPYGTSGNSGDVGFVML